MSIINGVDPIVVNTIKIQTQKPIITETNKTKISQNKQHKEKNEHNAPNHPENLLSGLTEAVDKLNKLLEQNKISLYFQITDAKIQLISLENHNIITVMSPEKVIRLVKEFSTRGVTLDELI